MYLIKLRLDGKKASNTLKVIPNHHKRLKSSYICGLIKIGLPCLDF